METTGLRALDMGTRKMSISLFANNLTSKALDLGEQLLQRINDFIPGRRNRDFPDT